MVGPNNLILSASGSKRRASKLALYIRMELPKTAIRGLVFIFNISINQSINQLWRVVNGGNK
jgi:hypothetical protein